MSERERIRRLHVENRLQELDWKLGRDRGPEPESVDCEPSWGPVGTFNKPPGAPPTTAPRTSEPPEVWRREAE